MKACAIIGERPTAFKFKYNENESRCKRLKKRLHDQFALLYGQGVRRFLVGGMPGVDQWSGEILLKMKLEQEFQDIELVVVVPCPGHDAKWDRRSRERLAFLIQHSAEKITIGTTPGPEHYRKKDRYLADHADCLVAVYDWESAVPCETSKTVAYAVKKPIPVICISPDKGVMTTM